MKQEVVTVGLNLAKNVFQVHAIGSDGAVLVRRKLRRTEAWHRAGERSRRLATIRASAR